MTLQPTPMSPAERSRRYRERKRDNIHLINFEIDEPVLQGLIALGFVAADDSRDHGCIEDGIWVLMQAVAEGGIDIRDEWIEQFG